MKILENQDKGMGKDRNGFSSLWNGSCFISFADQVFESFREQGVEEVPNKGAVEIW